MNCCTAAPSTFKYLIHSKVPATMKYNLNELQANAPKSSTWTSLGKLLQLISHERKNLWMALTAILINSALNLFAWYLIGKTIDKYLFTRHPNYHGLLVNCGYLLSMYA